MTRAQINALREQEISSHNQKMQALDAFLKLIDPATDAMPPAIVEMLRGGKIAPSPAQSQKPNGKPRALNILELTILRAMEEHRQEWNTGGIKQFLIHDGYQLPASPEASSNAINGALYNLIEAGKVTRVYQGRGRDPHRYKAVNMRFDLSEDEQEAPEEAS